MKQIHTKNKELLRMLVQERYFDKAGNIIDRRLHIIDNHLYVNIDTYNEIMKKYNNRMDK
jgi:hypothetical protein